MDRANLQKEVASLNSEINRISESANFNGIKLLDGSIGEATGVGIGKADAVAGTAVDSAGVIAPNTTTKGVLVKGKDAVAGRGSFYMSNTIQVGHDDSGAGAAGEGEFTLTVGNGKGNNATIKVELDGGAAAGDMETYSMEDIVKAIKGDTIGGITVTITADADGVIQNAADLVDNYNIDFSDNKLIVEAKTAGADWDSSISAYTSNTGAAGDGAEDILAMTQSLQNDLDGDGTGTAPANIALGAVTEQARIGEDAVAGRYTVASTQVTLNAANALHGQALKVGDKTYIMKDMATDLDPDLQALYDDDTTGNIEIVEFDSTAAAGNSVGSTALTNAINANKGTTHIQALNNAGTLTLSETEAYGNAILAAKDESMITDMDTATGVSGLAVGAFGERTKIGIDADLEEGSQITIGNNTYQFLNDPTDAVDGKIGVQFTSGNASTNAQALLDAIKAKDPAMANASLDADGKTVLLADDTAATASSRGLTLQVGETSDSYQKVSVVVKSTSTTSLGIDGIDIGTQEGAAAAIDKVKAAINSVSSTRGDLGAIQNRLEHTINNLSVTNENMTAAESRIRDVDMAKEMMTYTKNNILVQASQAMLAQANQVPQGVLQLLQ